MEYFFGSSLQSTYSCFSSSIWQLFSIFFRYISRKLRKFISLDIFSCSYFYRIMRYLYLLISNFKLTLSSISTGLSFWYVGVIIISSNSVLLCFTFSRYGWDLLRLKVFDTSSFCWYCLSTKLHWTKTTPTTSRLFHHSLFCLLIFCVLPSIFMVSCICSCMLYPPFISNTTLLLILLMYLNKMISRQCFLVFNDVLKMMLNIWHRVETEKQIKRIIPRWSYYFEFTVFVPVFYFFKTCFDEQHVYLSFLSVLFAINCEQICVVHSCYCFSYSRISFQCLYLVKHWLISFL